MYFNFLQNKVKLLFTVLSHGLIRQADPFHNATSILICCMPKKW